MSFKIKYVPVFVKHAEAAVDFLMTRLGFTSPGCLQVFDNHTYALLLKNDDYMDMIILNTDDCIKDYHELKTIGVNFLSNPEYSEMGLAVRFEDNSGNKYLLIEERNYTDQ